MKPPASAIQTDGQGADVLFIHGTAADKSSWRVLTALVRERIRATVYDRRGAGSWLRADSDDVPLVRDHAMDAADVISMRGQGPVHVCALSFGAVVALELMTWRPDLVRSAVLFEPALSGDERISSVPRELIDEVVRLIDQGEPERAAEHFHRRALGDTAWNLFPTVVQKQMTSRGQQIRDDLIANDRYRVNYDGLRAIGVPVLLLQGGRSHKVFERPLQALHGVLPQSQRQVIERAAHFHFGDAWPEFAAALTGFIGV